MTARQLTALLCAACLASAVSAQGPGVHERIPSAIDPSARYVIYLHGRIIEDRGRRPTHDAWGVYEYDKVLAALAAGGVVVISEQRRPNTDIDVFARRVAGQVRQLLRAGVAPPRITVVGFSKGGGIAMRAAALLPDAGINIVLLAACGDGDFRQSTLTIHGRVLSLYETSDDVGRSCSELFALPGSTGERAETAISIGGGHGAFFRPHDAWLTPVRRWIGLAEAQGPRP